MKQEDIKKILIKLGHSFNHYNPTIKKWFDKQRSKYNNLPCELLDIRYSTQQDGSVSKFFTSSVNVYIFSYRNKCEFTAGIDEETSLSTVGFRIGSYAKGTTGVGPVDNLQHIPETMKAAVKVQILIQL